MTLTNGHFEKGRWIEHKRYIAPQCKHLYLESGQKACRIQGGILYAMVMCFEPSDCLRFEIDEVNK